MKNDPDIVPEHGLDLSSRSDRRLLGRAVRENWPVREELRPILVEELTTEFDRVAADLHKTEPGLSFRAARNVILIARIYVAMEGLNQLYEYGVPPKPYRRWWRHQMRWRERRRRS